MPAVLVATAALVAAAMVESVGVMVVVGVEGMVASREIPRTAVVAWVGTNTRRNMQHDAALHVAKGLGRHCACGTVRTSAYGIHLRRTAQSFLRIVLLKHSGHRVWQHVVDCL